MGLPRAERAEGGSTFTSITYHSAIVQRLWHAGTAEMLESGRFG